MSLEEILKSQGYTEEQIATLVSAMKENGVHVSKLEDPEATNKQLQEDNEKLRADNESLQKNKGAASGASEEVQKMKELVAKTRRETAVMIALTKAGASDVEYLMYRAERDGGISGIKEDENGKVTGVEELVDNLKKSCSAQFTAAQSVRDNPVRTNIKKLEQTGGEEIQPQTLEEAIAQKISGGEE